MAGWFNSTRGRLTVISLAVLAIGFVLADAGLYLLLSYSAHDDLDVQLRSEAIAISRRVEVSRPTAVYPGGQLPGETPSGLPVDIVVVGQDGVELQTPGAGLTSASYLDIAQSVLKSGKAVSWSGIRDSDSNLRRVYALPLSDWSSGHGHVLVASTPTAQVDSSVLRAMGLVVVLSLIALAVSALLFHWLVGRVLRPVQEIANIAESLSERDLHRRVEIKTPPDELGELVATFNRMLARLESGFNSLREFTADASHELRAPLALMAVELDRVGVKERSTADYQKLNELMRSEVRELSDLVERLLLLARADAGELEPHLEPVDVADFIHETSTRWARIAAQQGLTLEVDAPDAGLVRADRALTRRILDNLIDNAMKHSPSGGQIRLGARLEDQRWVFEVADQGPGVPPQIRDRVFQRFARADSARSRDGKGGAGLGLSVSSAFAQAEQGELRLADAAGGGAVFQLWLAEETAV